jgi:hypothetical protein
MPLLIVNELVFFDLVPQRWKWLLGVDLRGGDSVVSQDNG